MKYIKKVVCLLSIFTLLLAQTNLSFADTNVFTISNNPTATSVAISVAYSGTVSIPATIQVSGANYFKSENYNTLPGKSVQRTFSGLEPNSSYSILITTSNATYAENPLYTNTQNFTTLKTTTNETPPIIPSGTVPCNGPNDPPGCKPIAGGDSNTPAGGDSNTPAGGDSNSLKITSGIKNPLSDSFKDIPTFIKGVLRFFLLIGIPIVTLAIIYTGFLFVTAMGNSEKLKVAKKALIYTLIGAALLLGSLVITDAIQGTVEQIKSKNK